MIKKYYILDSIKGLMIGKYICRTKDEGDQFRNSLATDKI